MNEEYFNRVLNTDEKKLRILRSVLGKSHFGSGGIIEVDKDDTGIVYRINATGETVRTLNEAMQKAESTYISQIHSLTSTAKKSKLSGPAAIISRIVNKDLTEEQKRVLMRADINPDDLSKLEVDIMTASGQKDKGAMLQRLTELQKSGALDGITIVDDESARLLSLRLNGKQLSQFQATLLFRVTGHGLISDEIFEKPEKYSKIPKRFRTIFSERLMSLSGEELSDFLGFKGSTSGLAEEFSRKVLVTDPQYELLLKAATDPSRGQVGFAELLRSSYRSTGIAESEIAARIQST